MDDDPIAKSLPDDEEGGVIKIVQEGVAQVKKLVRDVEKVNKKPRDGGCQNSDTSNYTIREILAYIAFAIVFIIGSFIKSNRHMSETVFIKIFTISELAILSLCFLDNTESYYWFLTLSYLILNSS